MEIRRIPSSRFIPAASGVRKATIRCTYLSQADEIDLIAMDISMLMAMSSESITLTTWYVHDAETDIQFNSIATNCVRFISVTTSTNIDLMLLRPS